MRGTLWQHPPPSSGCPAPSRHSQQVLHSDAHQVQLHIGFCRNLLDVPKSINVGQDLRGEEQELNGQRAVRQHPEAQAAPLDVEASGMGRLHPQVHFNLVQVNDLLIGLKTRAAPNHAH